MKKATRKATKQPKGLRKAKKLEPQKPLSEFVITKYHDGSSPS